MKRTKEDKNRAFHKIVECIRTCETQIQTCRCDNMIYNFERLFQKDFPKIFEESFVLHSESSAKSMDIMEESFQNL